VVHAFGINCFLPDGQRTRAERNGHVLVTAIEQLDRSRLKDNFVRIPVENVLVRNVLVREMDGLLAKDYFGFLRDGNGLAAEENFSDSQNEINDSGAEADAQKAGAHAVRNRIPVVKDRDNDGDDEADGGAADRDFVRDDEVLEIDESGGDEQREQSGVDQRDGRPSEAVMEPRIQE